MIWYKMIWYIFLLLTVLYSRATLPTSFARTSGVWKYRAMAMAMAMANDADRPRAFTLALSFQTNLHDNVASWKKIVRIRMRAAFLLTGLRVLLGRMFIQETVAQLMCRMFFWSVAVPPSKNKTRSTLYRLQDTEHTHPSHHKLDRIDQCLIFNYCSHALSVSFAYPYFLSVRFEHWKVPIMLYLFLYAFFTYILCSYHVTATSFDQACTLHQLLILLPCLSAFTDSAR